MINTVNPAHVSITINDAMGRVMLNKKVQVQAGVNTIPIPVNNFSPGVYYLAYNEGKENNVIRFIKQ